MTVRVIAVTSRGITVSDSTLEGTVHVPVQGASVNVIDVSYIATASFDNDGVLITAVGYDASRATDFLPRTINLSLEEAFAMLDQITVSGGIFEFTSVTEILTFARQKALEDTASFSEVIVLSLSKELSDTANISEVVSLALSKVLEDTATFSEEVSLIKHDYFSEGFFDPSSQVPYFANQTMSY